MCARQSPPVAPMRTGECDDPAERAPECGCRCRRCHPSSEGRERLAQSKQFASGYWSTMRYPSIKAHCGHTSTPVRSGTATCKRPPPYWLCKSHCWPVGLTSLTEEGRSGKESVNATDGRFAAAARPRKKAITTRLF